MRLWTVEKYEKPGSVGGAAGFSWDLHEFSGISAVGFGSGKAEMVRASAF